MFEYFSYIFDLIGGAADTISVAQFFCGIAAIVISQKTFVIAVNAMSIA